MGISEQLRERERERERKKKGGGRYVNNYHQLDLVIYIYFVYNVQHNTYICIFRDSSSSSSSSISSRRRRSSSSSSTSSSRNSFRSPDLTS